jgi:hypothetical protein
MRGGARVPTNRYRGGDNGEPGTPSSGLKQTKRRGSSLGSAEPSRIPRIAAGSASRVIAFFNTFQAQHGGSARSPSRNRPRSAAIQQGGDAHAREDQGTLRAAQERKAHGAEWERTEQQIIAAANEGGVAGALEPVRR